MQKFLKDAKFDAKIVNDAKVENLMLKDAKRCKNIKDANYYLKRSKQRHFMSLNPNSNLKNSSSIFD